jgi:hypothetical protein
MAGVPLRPGILGATPKLEELSVGAMLGLCGRGRRFMFKISRALYSSQTWQIQLNDKIYLVSPIHDLLTEQSHRL